MSPQLQRQIALQEQAEAKEAREEERLRAQRREALEENAIRAAINQAVENGQEFHPRMLRGERLGRTRQEAIAYYSELQDMEDRRAEVREAKEFENWKIQRSASLSGETSADLILSERAEQAKHDERAREARLSQAVRRYVKDETVREARKASLGDTAKILYATERARNRY
jgi:hypothetical protein